MNYVDLSASIESNEEHKEKVNQLLEPIILKTYQDAEFKAEFMANPKEVIERETGEEIGLPSGFNVSVVDKSDPFAIYITIPVNEEMLELTDEELELVAGGVADIDIDNENCGFLSCLGRRRRRRKGVE